MRARQPLIILAILNDEELEGFKAIDRCPVAACREGEPFALSVIVPFLQDDLPKPDHLIAGGREAVGVDAVVAELLEVQFALATNQRFHLLIVEQALDEAHIKQSFEAFAERSELSFALLDELEIDVQANELGCGLLGHLDVYATWLELFRFYISICLNIDCKSAAQYIFHCSTHFCVVPVEHLLEALRRFRLPLTQIVQVGLLTHEHLEAGHWERQVDEGIIVDGNAHQDSNQLEVNVRF